MRIDVTQEDIDCGVRCDCRNCPVARAIRRRLRDGLWISVEDEMFSINGPKGSIDFELPDSAQEFIFDFDGNKTLVGPVSFDLPIDQYCTPTGG